MVMETQIKFSDSCMILLGGTRNENKKDAKLGL
jgi:hypothetical protein